MLIDSMRIGCVCGRV